MSRRVLGVLLLAVLAASIRAPAASAADPVDISGDWQISQKLHIDDQTFWNRCIGWITQDIDQLLLAMACESGDGAGVFQGGISKEDSFTVEGTISGLHMVMDGVVLASGDEMSGTWSVVRSGPFGARRYPNTWGSTGCIDFVSAVDALIVLQYSSELLLSSQCLPFADVNVDGAVDVTDALLILQYVAGLIERLPVLPDA